MGGRRTHYKDEVVVGAHRVISLNRARHLEMAGLG